jgi:transposase
VTAGRPTKYDPAYCEQVVEHMAQGASLTSFAAQISVARSTINQWMDDNPEFSEAVHVAKAKCAAWWELCGRNIAMGNGGPGASTLAVFGMKNMAPDDWRDKTETAITNPDGSLRPTLVRIEAAPCPKP